MKKNVAKGKNVSNGRESLTPWHTCICQASPLRWTITLLQIFLCYLLGVNLSSKSNLHLFIYLSQSAVFSIVIM